MAGQLLSQQQLTELVEAPAQSRSTTLRELGWSESAEQPAGEVQQLDQQLSALLLDDLIYLLRPLSGEAREFLLYWAHRFEIANLKAIIRGRLQGQSTDAIKNELVQLGQYETLHADQLLRTEDVAELLRQLEGNPHYADIARQARRVFEDRHDPFTLDASIDRQYYAGLSRRAAKIHDLDGAYIQDMVGKLIDRINLVWLLRYRFAYGLPPAEAYYLLVPAGDKLTGRRLLALAELGSWEEIRSHLPAVLQAPLAEASNTSEVRNALHRELMKLARRLLEQTTFNLARVFAYLLLREYDLRRVGAILKGKHLRVDTALINEAAELVQTPD